MPTLLTFATEMERDGVFPNGIPKGCEAVISGVGILSTSLKLSKLFSQKKYDLAIQIGIVGLYPNNDIKIKIGEVLNVKGDTLVEFLPWEPNLFFPSAELPFEHNLLPVKAATVMHCASTDEIGRQRGLLAQIESMEGAAFFAACEECNVPCVQVRAVSNITADNKSEWKIEEALKALSNFFLPLQCASSNT